MSHRQLRTAARCLPPLPERWRLLLGHKSLLEEMKESRSPVSYVVIAAQPSFWVPGWKLPLLLTATEETLRLSGNSLSAGLGEMQSSQSPCRLCNTLTGPCYQARTCLNFKPLLCGTRSWFINTVRYHSALIGTHRYTPADNGAYSSAHRAHEADNDRRFLRDTITSASRRPHTHRVPRRTSSGHRPGRSAAVGSAHRGPAVPQRPGGAAKLPPTSRGPARPRPRSDVRPPPAGRILPRGRAHAAHPQRTEENFALGPALPSNALQAAPRCPGPAEGAPRPAREAPRRPFRGAALRGPPLRRPRSAAAVRRAAPGERSGAGRAGGAAAGGNKAPLCGGPGRAGGREPCALPRLPPNPRRTHGPPPAHRALRCSRGRAPRPRHRLPPGARPPRRSRRRRSRRHVTRRGGQAGAGTAAAPPRPGGAGPAGSRRGAGPAFGAARGARPAARAAGRGPFGTVWPARGRALRLRCRQRLADVGVVLSVPLTLRAPVNNFPFLLQCGLCSILPPPSHHRLRAFDPERVAGRGFGSEIPQTRRPDPGRARGSLHRRCRPAALAPCSRRRKQRRQARLGWWPQARTVVLTFSVCVVVEETAQQGGQSGSPALKRTVSLTFSAVPVSLWP